MCRAGLSDITAVWQSGAFEWQLEEVKCPSTRLNRNSGLQLKYTGNLSLPSGFPRDLDPPVIAQLVESDLRHWTIKNIIRRRSQPDPGRLALSVAESQLPHVVHCCTYVCTVHVLLLTVTISEL